MFWPVLPPPHVLRYRRRQPVPEREGSGISDDTAGVDEIAVQRAKAGDVDGFNDLVQRHQTAVFNVVLRTVRDPALAEDITQESFLRAWRAIDQFRGGSVKGWLMRIAVNRSYDALRGRKRRPADSLDALQYDPVPEWSSQAAASEHPEDFSTRRELSVALEQLLASLPDDQRTALLLVDLQGFAYDEAAGIMGVAPGTIKSRISRARATLRDELRTNPESAELFGRYLRQSSDGS